MGKNEQLKNEEISQRKCGLIIKIETILKLLEALPFVRSQTKEKIDSTKKSFLQLKKSSVCEIQRKYRDLLTEYKNLMPESEKFHKISDISLLKISVNKSLEQKSSICLGKNDSKENLKENSSNKKIASENIKEKITKLIESNKIKGRAEIIKLPISYIKHTRYTPHKLKTTPMCKRENTNKTPNDSIGDFEGLLKGFKLVTKNERIRQRKQHILNKYISSEKDTLNSHKTVNQSMQIIPNNFDTKMEFKNEEKELKKWDDKIQGEVLFADVYENFSLSRIDFHKLRSKK